MGQHEGVNKKMKNPIKILIVDDEKNVIDAYTKILNPNKPVSQKSSRFNELENKLFNDTPSSTNSINFELHCYNQGPVAVKAVRESIAQGKPFSVAFLDVRMPPGPNGVWTAKEIRQLDPYINIVMVTAYSDISPSEIAIQVPPPERLLYMQKPFHTHEIQQFASALTAKWTAEKDLVETNLYLDQLVKERTKELTLAIEAMENSNKKYRSTTHSLHETEAALAAQAQDLEGTNETLQKMISKNKAEKKEVEEKVLFAVHEMIEPYLDQLEKSRLDDYQKSFVKIIRTNIEEIAAPFMKNLSHKYFRLNPTEINIANLIKQGITTKEISQRLEMTKRNVDFYRDRIREKIGIKNTKSNLKTVLKDLEIEFSRK